MVNHCHKLTFRNADAIRTKQLDAFLFLSLASKLDISRYMLFCQRNVLSCIPMTSLSYFKGTDNGANPIHQGIKVMSLSALLYNNNKLRVTAVRYLRMYNNIIILLLDNSGFCYV